MLVIINFQGHKQELDFELPATMLDIKQMITNKFNIPVNIQNLLHYPPEAENDRNKLEPFVDGHTFERGDHRMDCVLTIGHIEANVRPWANFYLKTSNIIGYASYDRHTSHKFRKVADLKQDLDLGFFWHKNIKELKRGNNVLEDNINFYECLVQIGSVLNVNLKSDDEDSFEENSFDVDNFYEGFFEEVKRILRGF